MCYMHSSLCGGHKLKLIYSKLFLSYQWDFCETSQEAKFSSQDKIKQEIHEIQIDSTNNTQFQHNFFYNFISENIKCSRI